MIVIGIDLSLTGLGLVAVPGDWGLDWRRVKRATLATRPGVALVDRRAALADDVVRWVDWARGTDMVDVWIEGSITGGGRANSIRSQLMLAGVVEHELRRRLGVYAQTAEQTAVRKLLLGFEPPRDKKAHVLGVLEQLTPTVWDPNEYDAFASANYGLSEAGLAFVTIAK